MAVAHTATAGGHSFSGNTCMATTGSQCANGNLLATITSVKGTIAGNAQSIDATYTIELFCGGVLACVENGQHKGLRHLGPGNSPDASWLVDQSWTVSCCPGRHTASTKYAM